jgi:vancomycin resistance protein VanJ
LEAWNADVVMMQDCKTILLDSLEVIDRVQVVATPDFCVVSRWPVRFADSLPTRRHGLDGTASRAARFDVRVSGTLLPIYTVHLPSPRTSLWKAWQRQFEGLSGDIAARTAQSDRASQWVDRSERTFIVAGDFNLPHGSAILRSSWGDLDNAFSRSGWGFGYTMFAGRFAVRIDHILISKTIGVRSVRVLRGFPSEHQPVVADLTLPR